MSALFAATTVPEVALAPLAFAGDLATILALTALVAGVGVVGHPAEFALVPHVVAPEELVRASGVLEAAR